MRQSRFSLALSLITFALLLGGMGWALVATRSPSLIEPAQAATVSK